MVEMLSISFDLTTLNVYYLLTHLLVWKKLGLKPKNSITCIHTGLSYKVRFSHAQVLTDFWASLYIRSNHPWGQQTEEEGWVKEGLPRN